MKIDREKIKYLERLARIELAPDEIESMTEQLDRIVKFVTTLQAADTSGVDAAGLLGHGGSKDLREDVIREGLKREVVKKMAPDFVDGFFRVPRVIDKENG
jgi:aspartyl-tRNA(Asn)/glutamyl-tRNA(Gln) amidotransferase subunit C